MTTFTPSSVDLKTYLLQLVTKPPEPLLNLYKRTWNVDVSQHFSEVDVVRDEEPLDGLDLPARMLVHCMLLQPAAPEDDATEVDDSEIEEMSEPSYECRIGKI